MNRRQLLTTAALAPVAVAIPAAGIAAVDPVLIVGAERTAVFERYGDEVPNTALYGRLQRRVKELDAQVLATRATTTAGALWKMKQLVEVLLLEEDMADWQLAMAQSVLADLERLAAH